MASNDQGKGPSKDKEDIKKKFSETLDSIKKSDKVDSVVSYAQEHTIDTIAYVILLIGLIWMFTNPFVGAGIVGLVIGYYFSKELVDLVKGANSKIEEHGLAKSIVFAGAALLLLWNLPGLVIGAAIAASLSVVLKK